MYFPYLNDCPSIITGRRGEHRSSARRLPGSNSHSNHAYRFCAVPTGDIGSCCLCTRALFHIAANFHRRTANGRPYGCRVFGKYDHFPMEIYLLILSRIKTIISPFYRVALDVFPNLQIIFFAANHMVVEQLLPNRMTYLLCDIALHLLNNG